MNKDNRPSAASSAIPAAVREFLLENFHSVEQLEILLLLRRNPNRMWTVHEVNTAIRTDLDSARNRLNDLHRRKFLTAESKDGHQLYRFASDYQLLQAVDELDGYYKTHSTRIIELLYSRSPDSVLEFSKSFRIWPKGNKGS